MRNFLRPSRLQSIQAPLLDDKNEPSAGLDTPRLDVWDDDAQFGAFETAQADAFVDALPAEDGGRLGGRKRICALVAVLLVAVLLTVGALGRPRVWSSAASAEPGRALDVALPAVATSSATVVGPSSSTLEPSQSARTSPVPVPVAPTDVVEPEPREACADGRTDCRFLIVASVSEQETRAIAKIAQAAIFARETNRTLVLPRAHNGRYDLCRAHPFTSYHDIDAVSDLLGVRAIAWHDFTAFARQQASASSLVSASYMLVTVRASPKIGTDCEGQRPRPTADQSGRHRLDRSMHR